MNLILKAADFAQRMHEGQTRRGGMPYITHPVRVATLLMVHPKASEELICAAFLHDVIEDCGITYELLVKEFNNSIATLVQEVSNPSKNLSGVTRAERKRIDREHIAKISFNGKLIKLADRVDNLMDSIGCPIDWITKYLEESKLLLEVLKGVDDDLEVDYTYALSLLNNHIELVKKVSI